MKTDFVCEIKISSLSPVRLTGQTGNCCWLAQLSKESEGRRGEVEEKKLLEKMHGRKERVKAGGVEVEAPKIFLKT